MMAEKLKRRRGLAGRCPSLPPAGPWASSSSFGVCRSTFCPTLRPKTVRFGLEITRSLLRRFCLSSFLRSGYVFGVCQLVVGPLRAVLGLFGEPGGARVHQGQLGSGGKSPSSPGVDFVKHGEPEGTQVSSQVNECIPDVAKAMGECIAAASLAMCACTRETRAATLFLACIAAAARVEMHARSKRILSRWRPIGASCALPLGGYMAGGSAVAAARSTYPRHILHRHHASQGAGSEHGFWQGDDFAKHDESEGIRISCQKHECTRGLAKAMSECIPAVVTAMCACVGSVAAQACHDGREAQEATGACRAMSLTAPSRALGLEFFLWCLSQHFLSHSSAKNSSVWFGNYPQPSAPVLSLFLPPIWICLWSVPASGGAIEGSTRALWGAWRRTRAPRAAWQWREVAVLTR